MTQSPKITQEALRTLKKSAIGADSDHGRATLRFLAQCRLSAVGKPNAARPASMLVSSKQPRPAQLLTAFAQAASK